MAGPILETKVLRLIFQKNGQKNVLKMWAKYENILNKDRLLLAIIACNKLLKKPLNGQYGDGAQDPVQYMRHGPESAY